MNRNAGSRRKSVLATIIDRVRFMGVEINSPIRGRAASPSTYHGPHNNGFLEEELAWLREAGFEDVDCFWKFTTMVVYGGFKS